MPKITSDGKLIFVGRKSLTFKPLTDDNWAFIEEQSKFPLTPKLRLQLNRVVSQYVTYGPSALGTVTAKSIQGWLEIWESRTNIFRRQLSINVPKQTRDKLRSTKTSTPKQTQAILDRFFSEERYSKPNVTADDIVHMLDGASKLAGAMVSRLTAKGSVRVTRKKFWLVWIALLICLFRSQNIPISWRSEKKKKKGIHKGFVEFVRQLQKLLPDECKPRNTFTSIRKGVIQALPLAHKKPIKKLKSVLLYWGQGRFDIYEEADGYGFRNPRMFGLARFLEKIEAQSNK